MSVIWMPTINGKKMPVDASTVPSYIDGEIYDAKKGHVSHFATCKQAAGWRKPKPKAGG